MKAHPRTTYRIAAPQTWHLIRGAYLSGASAGAVAARFGVSVSAIRKRAAREGWTKRAYARLAADAAALGDAGPGADARGPASPPPVPDPHAAPHATPDAAPDAAQALTRRLWPPPEVSSATVSRKALDLSLQALHAGRGLEARRLAAAAREIAELDDRLPIVEAQDDPEVHARRQADMALFIREMALDLALSLEAGAPLPHPYADLEAALRRRRAQQGKEDAEDE